VRILSLLLIAVVLIGVQYGSSRMGKFDDDCLARQVALGEPIQKPVVSCRDCPLSLMVLNDARKPLEIDDTLLRSSLVFVVPNFSPPTAGLAMHEAALWCYGGDTTSVFPTQARSRVVSCGEILDHLLDYRTLGSGFANVEKGFLIAPSAYGMHANLAFYDLDAQEPTEFHFGQLVKTLGIAGVPAYRPVQGNGGAGTVRDLVSDLVMNFSIDHELEFVSIALAHYYPESAWENQFGEKFTFDQLIFQLAKTELGEGACNGCHVPIAVATLVSADKQFDLLSPAAEMAAHGYLKRVSHALKRSELPDGGWAAWGANKNSLVSVGFERLTTTGHHLEWIAISDPADCPPEDVIVRATKAIGCALEEIEARGPRTFKAQLPATHAARALMLLSGHCNSMALLSETFLK